MTRSATTQSLKRSTEEALEREADKPESLVPITIDFDVTSNNPDVSGIKIKDRFLWNMNGELEW